MDINYEIRRRIPNYRHDYLFNRVKNEPNRLLSDNRSYMESALEFIKKYWPIFLVFMVIPLLFILILPKYTSIFNFSATSVGVNGTQEFLKSTLAVPLSLIGIIIPITILIIEFSSRMSDR